MKKIILPILLSCFLFSNLAIAQHFCGTYEGYLQDEMKKYPEFYNSIEDKNNKLKKDCDHLIDNLNEKENAGERKIIPVVVHIIHDFGNENVTDTDVNYAIDQLNKNINRQADNMLTTPEVFAAVAGSANVEFRLAKLAPKDCETCDEEPTNGIVRIHSKLTDVPSPRDIVKSLSYWNSYQYFNIWVVRSLPSSDGNTLLGYAQFPWSGSMSTDGVVLLASEFKDGHTLTHEVGHWLGLRHTWGDALCGDDGVADTPPAKEENWGVQLSDFPHNLNVCVADSINPAGEMFVNYMDYSPDQVTSMFTDGQMEIVNQTLEGDELNYPYRRYLWSQENLEKTGTTNGYRGEPCNKKPDFIENYSNNTNCLGELNVLKGNKNIFSNISSLTWEWGDGSTSSTTNSPQHTYTAAGTYDVTLNVVYTDDVTSKSYSIDDVSPGYTSLETVTETKILEGTLEELNAVNATNITLHLDDSNYSVTLDTLFYRGEYVETYYLAHYESTCNTSVTKENFITILPVSASNTNNSYKYSFESSDLEDDFQVLDNELVSDWNFNISANPNWETTSLAASDGNYSIMMDGKKLTSANSIVFETQAYNLSDLSEPAISFDFIGAAVNSFPRNELIISYSKECGVWKELSTISAEEVASAGYFSQDFVPDANMIWNDTVMYDRIGSNDLKSENVRFRFEYTSVSLANRLYIDNIRIGEEADLLINPTSINRYGLSVYPNPSTENSKSFVMFETLSEGNVDVRMYNVVGSEVKLILNKNLQKGHHSHEFNLEDIEEGVYFISILVDGKLMETTKVVVQ